MSAPVPILPDGTPNFPAGSSGSIPGGSGQVTIWTQIVKPVTQEMAALGINKIWFGTGTHKSVAYAQSPGAESDSQVTNDTTKLVDIGHPAVLQTPEKIMADFYAMSYDDPNKFIALQKALAEGPWGTVDASGSLDSKTESALIEAMKQWVKLKSTGVEVSLSKYILDAAERRAVLSGGGSTGGGGSSSAAPFQAQLMNPEAIRSAAQTAFQNALGRGATNAEMNKFISTFQSEQTSAERTAFNAQGTSNPVTDMPTVGDAANQFAQQSNPGQYKQHQVTAYTNALVNLMLSGGGQGQPLPSITPVAQA